MKLSDNHRRIIRNSGLEYMETDPYSELQPGDMGTVKTLDDAGGLHISWDRGGSLALIYKADRCNCLMKREQMDALFKQLAIMPFESYGKMKTWIEQRLRPAFPAMSFDDDTEGRLGVHLNVNAFGIKNAKIGMEYRTDEKGHLFIEKCGWIKDVPAKESINKAQKSKR